MIINPIITFTEIEVDHNDERILYAQKVKGSVVNRVAIIMTQYPDEEPAINDGRLYGFENESDEVFQQKLDAVREIICERYRGKTVRDILQTERFIPGNITEEALNTIIPNGYQFTINKDGSVELSKL